MKWVEAVRSLESDLERERIIDLMGCVSESVHEDDVGVEYFRHW